MPATIPVLVSESASAKSPVKGAMSPVKKGTLGATRTLGSTLGAEKSAVRNLDISNLKASVADLASQLSEVFRDLKAVGGFKLTEVTVSVEVSAEGSVFLVGKAGVSGGISLKFEP